ncbi:hypothetical protein [Sphingomonas sp. G-3-2-10]|uniref:hypothetical protein n=1 Tax=Sphingomonas sp. G-3-2-10 TaxID=2728838 RepID=UPI00146E3F57|nr:hypothetical protein [Sphingomonas sp. G-3-2-10]NML07470.1 hypothetical protein [Sphingomonas sp. G-3-2-10]
MSELTHMLAPLACGAMLTINLLGPEAHSLRRGLSLALIALCTALLMSSYYQLPVPDFIPPAAAKVIDRALWLLLLVFFVGYALSQFFRDYRTASRQRAERTQL